MTLKINFNLNLPDSCCTLVPKNGVWTVPKIAACQIAKNAALLIPDYTCWSINIADILSVKRSYNLLSSPAGSLKRLSVNFRGKVKFPYILISPICEKEFIKELKVVNPNILIHIPDKKGIWRIQDWDI